MSSNLRDELSYYDFFILVLQWLNIYALMAHFFQIFHFTHFSINSTYLEYVENLNRCWNKLIRTSDLSVKYCITGLILAITDD